MKIVFITLWLFSFFILIRGYDYGSGNALMFLASINRLIDTGFLGDDWYISALVPYHYQFKLAIVFFSKFLELPVLFFVGYSLTILLYIASLYLLCKTVSKEINTFYILLPILLLLPTSGIEGNAFIQQQIFQPLFLATPICVFAITALLNNRTMLAYILAGIATNIHLQMGVNLFLFFLIFNFFNSVKDGFRFDFLNKLILAVIGYALVSAYVLLWAFRSLSGARVEQAISTFFIDYLRFRMPHHCILSTWTYDILRIVSLFFLGIIGFKTKDLTQTDRKISTFILITLLFCLLQYIFIEIYPVNLIAKFQFYRMSIFVTLFIYIYFADFLRRNLEKKNSILIPVAALCAIASSSLHLSLILAVFIILINTKEEIFNKTTVQFTILLITAIFAAVLYFVKDSLPAKISNIYLSNIGTFYVIAAAYLILRGLKLKSFVLPILIIISFISVFGLGPVAETKAKEINIYLDYGSDPWKNLCLWVKKHAPVEAFFITPPYEKGFHLYAERKTLVEFKANPFPEKDILIWKERLEEVLDVEDIFNKDKSLVYRTGNFMKSRYNRLTENSILSLAKKYNADYIIFERPKELGFTYVFSNKRFIIYKIPRR